MIVIFDWYVDMYFIKYIKLLDKFLIVYNIIVFYELRKLNNYSINNIF